MHRTALRRMHTTTTRTAKGARMCEADERNTRAVFELEMMAGNWVFDLARIKQILTGAEPCQHEQTS